MNPAPAGRPDAAGLIEALRARGAPRLDAVRFRHIEALARRAAAQQGETRRLLEQRLAPLLAACGQALALRPAADLPPPAPPPSALAGLLAHIARQAAAPGAPDGSSGPAGSGGPGTALPAELRSVREHRSTWSRLSVDQRLSQSQARVPPNAGPLNTPWLLHQALTLMRDASPAYVQRFMAHVEALLWLDQARPAGSVAPPPAPALPASKAAASKPAARSHRGKKPAG